MTALEGQSLPRSRARAQGLAGHWATVAAWGQGHHHGHSWAKVLTLPQHSVDAALKRRKRKGSGHQQAERLSTAELSHPRAGGGGCRGGMGLPGMGGRGERPRGLPGTLPGLLGLCRAKARPPPKQGL